MPTYLCHGFRWHRRYVRFFIIVQNLEDAAPDWVIGPASATALLTCFYDIFDAFLPPCRRGVPCASLPPRQTATPTTPPKTECSPPGIARHDDGRDQVLATQSWSAVKLLEEFDPANLAEMSRPHVYVADYVVRIDLSVSVAAEMARYEGQRSETAAAAAAARPSPSFQTNTNTPTTPWIELLRDQLQRGEPLGWYVVVTGDEERAWPMGVPSTSAATTTAMTTPPQPVLPPALSPRTLAGSTPASTPTSRDYYGHHKSPSWVRNTAAPSSGSHAPSQSHAHALSQSHTPSSSQSHTHSHSLSQTHAQPPSRLCSPPVRSGLRTAEYSDSSEEQADEGPDRYASPDLDTDDTDSVASETAREVARRQLRRQLAGDPDILLDDGELRAKDAEYGRGEENGQRERAEEQGQRETAPLSRSARSASSASLASSASSSRALGMKMRHRMMLQMIEQLAAQRIEREQQQAAAAAAAAEAQQQAKQPRLEQQQEKQPRLEQQQEKQPRPEQRPEKYSPPPPPLPQPLPPWPQPQPSPALRPRKSMSAAGGLRRLFGRSKGSNGL